MLDNGYKYYIIRKIFNDSSCTYDEVFHTNDERKAYLMFDYYTSHFPRFSFVIVKGILCYKPKSWIHDKKNSSNSRL